TRAALLVAQKHRPDAIPATGQGRKSPLCAGADEVANASTAAARVSVASPARPARLPAPTSADEGAGLWVAPRRRQSQSVGVYACGRGLTILQPGGPRRRKAGGPGDPHSPAGAGQSGWPSRCRRRRCEGWKTVERRGSQDRGGRREMTDEPRGSRLGWLKNG